MAGSRWLSRQRSHLANYLR